MSTLSEANPILGSVEEPLTVRLRSEYRRCSLYVVVGFTLVTVLVAVLPPQRAWWPMGLILGPCVLLWLYVQSWRLRIDRTGLARRRLGVWSTWTWSQFADGTVQATDSPLSFRCPTRPWWDRWLHLEFADADVATRVARFCRSLMPVPTAESDAATAVSAPTEATIGFGIFRRLRLTAQGIELQDRRETGQYDWDAVLTFRLVRRIVQHGVVNRLELHVQGMSDVRGQINSVVIDGQRIGTIGKRQMEWASRLSSLVPPRCWQVFQTFGDLQSRADGEFRLAHWRKSLTTVRRWQPWLPLAFLALGAWGCVPKLVACWNAQFVPPWWKAVALVCLTLVMLWPAVICWALLYYSARVFADRIRKTEDALVRLSAADRAAASAPPTDET
ncbi:MAG: hypothetical protein GX575_01695 [Candidatus Anammoximicrobium sp.]|nr:hypothetical protein [Candidatus Anammoximicrobium sp.]